jgi:hypothetical protein
MCLYVVRIYMYSDVAYPVDESVRLDGRERGRGRVCNKGKVSERRFFIFSANSLFLSLVYLCLLLAGYRVASTRRGEAPKQASERKERAQRTPFDFCASQCVKGKHERDAQTAVALSPSSQWRQTCVEETEGWRQRRDGKMLDVGGAHHTQT